MGFFVRLLALALLAIAVFFLVSGVFAGTWISMSEPIKDFTLPDMSGTPVTLSQTSGPILLNFWASWCPPCREEIPSLNMLQRQFPGLTILAVSSRESHNTVVRFMEKTPIQFRVLVDEKGAVSDLYRIRFIPQTFLVDRTGKVVARMPGPSDWQGPVVSRRIQEVMEGPAKK